MPDEPLVLEVLAHPRDGQGARGFHDAPSVVETQLDGLFICGVCIALQQLRFGRRASSSLWSTPLLLRSFTARKR